jgi:hypothetical protein
VALDIALSICEEFEGQFNGKLTMSAGVLIMREHLPIYYARKIVEMLLKSAKKAGRKARSSSDAVPPAYIDFQVITGDSSLSEDLEEYRKQLYSSLTLFRADYHPIQRPYRLDELRRLLDVARWARREFPASQLYQLQQAIAEHGAAWARNWYHYQLARSEGEQSEKWQQFHRQVFATDPWQDTEAPWLHKGAGQRTTPVIDLVEIFDYVRRG